MREMRLTKLLSTAEQHTRAGRLGRAVRCYRKVLSDARPGEHYFELAHYKLGSLHLELGQNRSAVAHLMRARLTDREEATYAIALGRALRVDDQYQKASSHLLDATTSVHHRAAALGELALSSAQSGDRNTARSLARLALRFAPTDPVIRDILISCSDA
jgi:Flp pilus assembly protein TadD